MCIVGQICRSSGRCLLEAAQKTKAESTAKKDPKKEINKGDVSDDEQIYERAFAVLVGVDMKFMWLL